MGRYLRRTRHAFRSIVDLAFPEPCAVCGRLLEADERHLCHDCQEGLEPISGSRCPACGKVLISELGICMRCRAKSWSFDEALPLYAYRGLAASLISAYKFAGHRSLASCFVPLLYETARIHWPGAAIVPVPFRRAKIVEKGWDQVEEIVCRLEKRGLPVARVLERLPSEEQKKLGLEARFENAKHAYRLRDGAKAPARAVLLDDVFTSGATAEACAKALKSGGSGFVAFLSLAAD